MILLIISTSAWGPNIFTRLPRAVSFDAGKTASSCRRCLSFNPNRTTGSVFSMNIVSSVICCDVSIEVQILDEKIDYQASFAAPDLANRIKSEIR